MGKRGEHSEQAEPGKVQRRVLAPMPEGYWLLIFALGSLILLVVIAWLGNPKTASVREPPSQTEYHDTDCKQDTYINWWFGIRHSTACIKGPIKTSTMGGDEDDDASNNHEGERNRSPLTLTEADLLAQERMAYWTFWIGLFTAFGLGALIWTLVLTRRATKAAVDAVDVTREMGQKQLRAYVEVYFAEVITTRSVLSTYPIPGHKKTIEAKITIKNFGSTPARDVILERSEKTIGKMMLDTFDTVPVPKNSPTTFTIAPGGQINILIDNELDEDEWEALVSEDCFMMMVGNIRYVDVFDQSRETTFCLKLENFGRDRMRIFPHTRGNSAT